MVEGLGCRAQGLGSRAWANHWGSGLLGLRLRVGGSEGSVFRIYPINLKPSFKSRLPGSGLGVIVAGWLGLQTTCRLIPCPVV